MKLVITLVFIVFSILIYANPIYKYSPAYVKINVEKFNSESITCLTKAIYFESNTQPRVGMYAVAEVILNRVRSDKFPDSICDVVTQRTTHEYKLCQFSYFCDGRPEKVLSQMMYKKCKEIAILAILNQDKKITKGATHYHATYVTPYWSKTLVKTIQIGDHIFYREDESS